MTDSERTLHTILSLCVRSFPKVEDDKAKIEQLRYRLEEIEIITQNRVIVNAERVA